MADKEIKIIFSKTEDGMNRLVLSGIYENNCSAEETVVVSDEVLEVFENARREQEKRRSFERRHKIKKIYLGNDEDFDSKLGLVQDAHDEIVQSDIYLEQLKQFFDEKIYRRGILHYLQKFTECEIARIEGVSQNAVSKSIIAFRKIVAKLYNIDLEE